MMLFGVSGVARAEVAVVFDTGFVGTIGTNTQDALNISFLSRYSITQIRFSQDLGDGATRFQLQGNDVPGNLTFFYTEGGVSKSVTIPGGFVWLDQPNGRVALLGFISNPSVNLTINGLVIRGDVDGDGARGETGDTNIGVFLNNRTTGTYSEGGDIRGSANRGAVESALNEYLASPTSQPPFVSSITNASAAEGASLAHTVTLSKATTTATTFAYSLTSGTATAGTDFNSTPTFSNGVTLSGGNLSVPTGVTSFTITYAGIEDSTNEPDETYTVTVGGKTGTGTILDNDPVPGPALKVVKIAATPEGVTLGKPINYTITVENTGNVNVTDVTVADTLTSKTGGALTLTSGPTLSSATSGSSVATLIPGGKLTYTASFTITQVAIDAGGVSNTATASGKDPNGATVSDVSDDGDNTDGNTTDDPTVSDIVKVATLKAVKTAATPEGTGLGKPINFTITVENTGNVTINDVTVSDTLTSKTGGALTLTSGPTFSSATSGSSVATLIPGGKLTYTASFTITQGTIDAGGVSNTATASGKDPGGATVSDVSDNGNNADGNTTNDSTVVDIVAGAALKVVKTATTPEGATLGKPINYTITVENVGNSTATDIAVVDTLTTVSGEALTLTSGPTFASATTGSSVSTLLAGGKLTYTASFTINQAAIDAGGVKNTATASGKDPSGTTVSDVSDNGDNTDGNSSDDATVTSIPKLAALKAVKTAALPEGASLGKPINFTITVENTGNVTIKDVTVSDTLTTATGGSLSLTSGPTFSSATSGSSVATLIPGGKLTYTASFTINQAAIDAGGVSNTATASGKDPSGATVSDVSDNGNDSDGNSSDDATVIGFPKLSISKTGIGGASNPLLAGSPTTYQVQVTNEGREASAGATVLETVGKGLLLNSLGGTGWVCTYANGEPLTLPAKGPLTAQCSTTTSIAAGAKAPVIVANITPLAGFLGLQLKTDSSVDPGGGKNPPPTGSSCAPSSACASNAGEVTPEALPVVTLEFDTPSIPLGGQARLTVTIINKTATPFTALALSQALPANLQFLANPRALTTCNGSVTASGGALALSGGSLAAGGSCNLSALVTSNAPSGTQITATTPASAIKNGQDKTNENVATASLTVAGNFAVRKSFESSQGSPGLPVRLIIAIDNSSGGALTEASFVDELPAAPGRMRIASDPKVINSCGGAVEATAGGTRLGLSGGSVPAGGCSLSAMVVTDTFGDYLNVIPTGGTSGSPNGLRGRLPNGESLSTAAGSSARLNVDEPSIVTGVFSRRVGFGTFIPVAGVPVTIKDADGRVVATTVTGPDGSYRFENLPPTLLGDASTKYRIEFGSAGGVTDNFVKGLPEAPNSAVNGVPDRNGITGISLLPGEVTPAQNGFLIDPSGVVYDSLTRAPIAGARVTLLGPDGLAVPNSLLDLTFGTANGAAVGSDGRYVLLLTSAAPSGTYRLKVDVPAGYRAATATTTSGFITAEAGAYVPAFGGGIESIQPQPTAPTLDENTRYFMAVSFVIGATPESSSNGIIHNHLPLDPIAPVFTGGLTTTKVGSVRAVELGDSIGYSITVTNESNVIQYGAVLRDTLPIGFRYIAESAIVTTPSRTLRTDAALGLRDVNRVIDFPLGNLRPGDRVTITYRARVGVGSTNGDGINRARASSALGANSNEARFAVRVDAGVFSNEACVIGAVYKDCNDNGRQDQGEPGVGGARLYFQDGAYAVTDPQGQYSFCGRTPTTHVIKVDPISLPAGSVLGDTTNRDAGNPGSVFVDLKNGEMQRVDFRIVGCQVQGGAR